MITVIDTNVEWVTSPNIWYTVRLEVKEKSLLVYAAETN